MKKTTTTCIWATDTKYILLTWEGGDYYLVERWLQQRCSNDTLEGQPEYIRKSQIRDCLVPQDKYNLMVHAPATLWLQYAINDGVDPMEARTRLIEGGVL